MRKTLAEMKNSESGVVAVIQGGRHFIVKLESLGIREGVAVEKKSSVLFKGPVILKVGTAEFALGYNMAKKIIVEV